MTTSSHDLQKLLDALAAHIVMWRQHFKDKEEDLATRLLPFMDGAKPLILQKPQRKRWAAYSQGVFWQTVSNVLFVNKRDIICDYPDISIEIEFAESFIESCMDGDPGKTLTLENEEYEFDFLHHELLLASFGDGYHANWNLGGALTHDRFQWLGERRRAPFPSVKDMLDDIFSRTLDLVAFLLMSKQNEEEAFLLLEMWGCGNYPLGFDKNNQLVVLCA